MDFAIHWFRRDLRVRGNPALEHAWEQANGKVVGLFCFDPKFLARPDFSPNRFQFFLETLYKVGQELKEVGSELLVLDQGPDQAFEFLLQNLKPKLITWNRDYENFARDRDARLERFFKLKGISTHTERDHLLIEPHEIVKPSAPKEPYQVFAPFQKKWLELFLTSDVQKRIYRQEPKLNFNLKWSDLLKEIPDVFESYLKKNKANVTVSIPKSGPEAAKRLTQIFKSKQEKYPENRDIPSIAGTSQLSIYFKNGSLTNSQVIRDLNLKSGKFLSELIWREFYYYILFHFPHVEKESFQPKYRNIKWQNSEKLFKAWCDGNTGYPIIDAGMRQLNQTGWMHNRVRMIVASFLTKDLLIDYKWGEQYFMEKLLDGDLAPNNGGWQWAASTGCDAQPYFRIFNPTLQAQRFDPENIYIKKWVPEFESEKYTKPIVDHAEQKAKALELYKVS